MTNSLHDAPMDIEPGLHSAGSAISNQDLASSSEADGVVADACLSEPRIELKSSLRGTVSLALWENSVPVLLELSARNISDRRIERMTLKLSSEPPVLKPRSWEIQDLPVRQYCQIESLDIALDGSLLASMSEATRATVIITAEEKLPDGSSTEIARQEADIRVLSRSEWGGLDGLPDLLAAFVLPNDPAVSVILRTASALMEVAGQISSFEGYQAGKKRVWEQAQAIWCAICALKLTYVSAPASFVESGQRIRLPSQILGEKLATCLDTAILFASCLEAAGIRPVLIMMKGHAFTGFWLSYAESGISLLQDLPGIRNRIALDDVCVFETTLATGVTPPSFGTACDRGRAQLEGNGANDAFEGIIDIHRARLRRIRPLPILVQHQVAEAAAEEECAVPALEVAPDLRSDEDIDILETPEGRLDRWCKRLLDLSGRSRLLNLPKSDRQIIELFCANPAVLEDRIAALKGGERQAPLRLRARPELMSGRDPRSQAVEQERHYDDHNRTLAAQALEHGELLVAREESSLHAALVEIYRKARAAQQEGGANVLFLTLGELVWQPRGRDREARAPLILLPVVLERSNINAPFRLRPHGDESMVNGSLLELLRQDFGMRFPALEADRLPQDESGLDIRRIFDIFRAGLRDQPNWEIDERVCLTTLSFAKFLMWKDLKERRDALRISPVATRLLDGAAEGEHLLTPLQKNEPVQCLDEALEEASLVCPMEADSSQLAAVMRAARGESFVLIGPPGTGKSQTIANIIADTLARGRTVLFVAEKRTALEVVRNRLKAVGLDAFCLDLFSPHAGRSAVLEQFRDAQNVSENCLDDEWQSSQKHVSVLRNELNAYVADLHHCWPNGWTPYRAIGAVLNAERASVPHISLTWESAATHELADWARLQEVVAMLGRLYVRLGPKVLVRELEGIEHEDWTSRWQENLLKEAASLRAALQDLGGHADKLVKSYDLAGGEQSCAQLERVRLLSDLLLQPEAAYAAWALRDDAEKIAYAALEEQSSVLRYRQIESSLVLRWRDVSAVPASELLHKWKDASEKWLLARKSGYKSVRRQVEELSEGEIPEDLVPEFEKLLELTAIGQKLNAVDYAGTLGTLWQGCQTDFSKIEAALLWGKKLSAALGSCVDDIAGLLSARRRVRELLTEGRDLLAPEGLIGRQIHAFQIAYTEVQAHRDGLSALAANDLSVLVPDGADWLPRLCALTTDWLEHGRNLRDWCAWRKVCHDAENLGLKPLVDALMQANIVPADINRVFEGNYARWWANAVIDETPRLRSFIAAAQEDRIERFSELDQKLAQLSQRLIRARLAANLPDIETRRREAQYVLLTREIAKKTRQMSIRQLAAAVPDALRTLTPCLMMSPLSVAQYLPTDSEPFDLVIFDEASQIPTWDAIGAVGRGKQVIVVGDPKQLPPTSFFARADTEEEIGEGELCDMESILDECRAAGIPEVGLRWHYRSRHESLIAFSNAQYYGGDLVTFPSPVTSDTAVSFRFVPDGIYSRGSARTNIPEARSVVAEVLRLLRSNDGRSIGVVTFNAEQQTLITDMLEKAQCDEPELANFFSDEAREPVLVRNLENIQGEERDIMLFSLTYAPELTGAPYVNFGPLNRAGGERRLNVAITRAREKLIVFGSLRAEQIDPARSSALGVLHLRKFLTFAEYGSAGVKETAGKPVEATETAFEQEVAELLRIRGWTVHSRVGASRFRIDLGIVDPDVPGAYLAGVECDGTAYHESATTRDRDRLRKAVLENLGWNILHVWSADWWLNSGREADRLDHVLRHHLELVRLKRVEQNDNLVLHDANTMPRAGEGTPLQKEEMGIVAEKPIYAGLVTMHEPVATYLKEPDALKAKPDRFTDESYSTVLQEIIRQTVNEKGPLLESALVQSVSRLHGYARAGRQIRDRILSTVPQTIPTSEEEGDVFFWPEGSSPEEPPEFRLPNSGESLDPVQIPMSMLVVLATRLRLAGLNGEEALTEMRNACGLGRMGAGTRKRLQDAWEKTATP